MTANQLLSALFNAGMVISVGTTVLSLGMSFTVGQLVAPLRRVWLVVAMVVLNSLVVPAAALGIAKAWLWRASSSRAWCWPPSARGAPRP